MTIVLIVGLVLVVIILLFLLWQRTRQKGLEQELRRTSEEMGKISLVLQGLQEQMVQHLSATAQLLRGQDQTISQGLSTMQGLVADLRERMGKVEEISRRVEEVAQDLVGLQDLFRAPKARGVFGEWVLSELLSEVLPRGRFQEQYRFRDGNVVDAAIFLENGIVPVDAKFPISGFEGLRTANSPEERKKSKKT